MSVPENVFDILSAAASLSAHGDKLSAGLSLVKALFLPLFDKTPDIVQEVLRGVQQEFIRQDIHSLQSIMGHYRRVLDAGNDEVLRYAVQVNTIARNLQRDDGNFWECIAPWQMAVAVHTALLSALLTKDPGNLEANKQALNDTLTPYMQRYDNIATEFEKKFKPPELIDFEPVIIDGRVVSRGKHEWHFEAFGENLHRDGHISEADVNAEFQGKKNYYRGERLGHRFAEGKDHIYRTKGNWTGYW